MVHLNKTSKKILLCIRARTCPLKFFGRLAKTTNKVPEKFIWLEGKSYLKFNHQPLFLSHSEFELLHYLLQFHSLEKKSI